MQLNYCGSGMQCEFTLMTIGEYRSGTVTPAPVSAVVRQASAAPIHEVPSRQPTTQMLGHRTAVAMPPPSQAVSRSFTKENQGQRVQRPSPPPPRASLDHESLFIPVEQDEDRMWGERNYDDDEDTLGWDASASRVSVSIIHWSITH